MSNQERGFEQNKSFTLDQHLETLNDGIADKIKITEAIEAAVRDFDKDPEGAEKIYNTMMEEYEVLATLFSGNEMLELAQKVGPDAEEKVRALKEQIDKEVEDGRGKQWKEDQI